MTELFLDTMDLLYAAWDILGFLCMIAFVPAMFKVGL